MNAVAKKPVRKTPARKNATQSLEAKAPTKAAGKPDVIKSVKNDNGGNYVVVTAGEDQTLSYLRAKESAELRKLAAVGASFKAVQAYLKTHKGEAKLATGLNGNNAPQSAAAAAASRKGDAKVPASATAAKPTTTAKKLPHKGDYDYKVGRPNDTRLDTWTHHMISVIQSKTNTADARAAHEKSGKFVGKKLDFTWAKVKGFIV
jgi:hypothetical protein